MEPLTLPDPAQAAIFTPWVMALAQVLKGSPRVNNAWVPFICVFLGFALALAALVANHQLAWIGGQLVGDSKQVYKVLIEGLGGGAGGPVLYKWQAGLPEMFRPFKSGPDNYGQAAAIAPTEAQGVTT